MNFPEVKIMIVDDDQCILDGFRRLLSRHFSISLCNAPMDALTRVDQEGPFAVVISDMHMPVMDGINFLAKVKERSPDSIRMMLTGDSDIKVAIDAVNEGQIFRFLTKPCDYKVLANAILTAIQQHRLVTAEKELLEKTLRGSISMLTEILSMTDPKLFGQASRVRDLVRSLAPKLSVEAPLDLEFAALLSPLGWVPIPAELREKARSGSALSAEERSVVARVPQVAHSLLARIPRLEKSAELVRLMHCSSSEAETMASSHKIPELLQGGRLLRILSDLALFESEEIETPAALEMMKGKAAYDQKTLAAVSGILGSASKEAAGSEFKKLGVDIPDLRLGDILDFNVETVDGRRLVSSGVVVTPIIKERLINFQALFGIKRPIMVRRRDA